MLRSKVTLQKTCQSQEQARHLQTSDLAGRVCANREIYTPRRESFARSKLVAPEILDSHAPLFLGEEF
jgi:hypothetical protein